MDKKKIDITKDKLPCLRTTHTIFQQEDNGYADKNWYCREQFFVDYAGNQ